MIWSFEVDLLTLYENFNRENPGKFVIPVRGPDSRKEPMTWLDGKLKNVYFLDHIKILKKNGHALGISQSAVEEIQTFVKKYNELRNGLSHADVESIKQLAEIKKDLLYISFSVNEINWVQVKQLVDGRFSVDYVNRPPPQIMLFDKPDPPQRFFPKPDYFDTGFVGREEEIEMIKAALSGDSPPVTVVGEGGIGKTSLLINVLEQMLNNSISPFRAVLWVSFKRMRLSLGGPEEIYNPVFTIDDAIREFSDQLHKLGFMEDEDFFDVARRIPLLIALDNLEVIDNAPVLDFLKRLGRKSSLIMSSRRSLGQQDLPIKLGSLNDNDLIQYYLCLQDAFKVQLTNSHDEILAICDNYFRNTLLIKMMIRSAAAGVNFNPLKKHAQFEEAVKFCVDNSYYALDSSEVFIINALYYSRRSLTISELLYIAVKADFDASSIPAAAESLGQSSLIKTNQYLDNLGLAFAYELTDIALHFVETNRLQELTPLVKEGVAALSDLDFSKFVKPYNNMSSLRPKQGKQFIAAHIIRHAYDGLEMLKNGKKIALDLIELAETIDPAYSDIERARAYIFFKSGDYHKALQHNLNAEQLDTESPLTKRHTAIIYMRLLEFDKAESKIREAREIDPNNLDFSIVQADIMRSRGNFEEALRIYESVMNRRSEILDDFVYGNLYKNYAVACNAIAVKLIKNHPEDAFEYFSRSQDAIWHLKEQIASKQMRDFNGYPPLATIDKYIRLLNSQSVAELQLISFLSKHSELKRFFERPGR